MKIVIAHLYYDLMNLYGESGNVKALKKYLEEQGVKVTIKFLSLNDTMDFATYDFVYIGAGSENNRLLVLKDLKRYQKDIKRFIDENKFILATGNAHEIFGQYIIDLNHKKHKALSIFDYYAKDVDFRIVDEVYFETPLVKKPLIGFQNQASILRDNPHPLFTVIMGVGSYPNSKTEGFRYHNFYGTYITGPLLIRNPHFTKYLVKTILKNKYPDYKYKNINKNIEETAYRNFTKHLLSIKQ
ncbi:MAG: glutamine amidotransferase [Bacilli bacterium]|nr:glutamine amidotransferase [Bacilli bacterium]